VRILKHIQILRADNNQTVDAQVVTLTADLARKMIDGIWWNDSGLSAASQMERDSHWIWEDIVMDYSNNNLHECIAILSQEQYLEGAMAYRLDAKSKIEIGKGSVYVGWLATAPRNRNWLTNNPFHKGIGTVLLYSAVIESYQSGLGGRISLQSLPTSSTVQFYENKGFVRTDWTQATTGLIDYELPKSAAITWLKKQGDLP
jgi:hypothetical protein